MIYYKIYSQKYIDKKNINNIDAFWQFLAGAAGFEPTAFGFGDRRSSTELRPYIPYYVI